MVAVSSANPEVAEPPSLREAIFLVTTLGGFLRRNVDGEPGTQSLRLGLRFRYLFKRLSSSALLLPLVDDVAAPVLLPARLVAAGGLRLFHAETNNFDLLVGDA